MAEDDWMGRDVMLWYKDMTFCSSDCSNSECFRHFGVKQQRMAELWWGDADTEPPVAMANFKPQCQWYKEPV